MRTHPYIQVSPSYKTIKEQEKSDNKCPIFVVYLQQIVSTQAFAKGKGVNGVGGGYAPRTPFSPAFQEQAE